MSEAANPAGKEAHFVDFHGHRIDLHAGRLTRAGVSIPLRAKTWKLLLYLVERPGILISRDELLDALWPGVAVTPDTLTKSIGELRQALADDRDAPRFIETVHRRGVRFIAQPMISSPPPAVPNRSAFELDEPAKVVEETAGDTFVGRGHELRRLEQLFAEASAGSRQCVFVTGTAGVGKSTLVKQFLARLAARGRASAGSSERSSVPVMIARGQCVEQHGPREPYMPVLEALDRLAREPGASSVAAMLRRVAPTWLVQMPWLLGDDAEALRQSLALARTERMLREFAFLTEALAADATLVLVLEDLHWSDPSTVDLLSFLAQQREPARLLVIGIYRPAEIIVSEHPLARASRMLQARHRAVELPVYELNEVEVADFLKARFPGDDCPPELARVLHGHTDGNPLFITAVVEDLLSRGAILDTSPGWSFTTPPDRSLLGVPDDACRIIATQFDRLAPSDQALLAAASIAGTEFLPAAIAPALGWSLDDVESSCEALAQSQRFLREAGVSALPDGSIAQRYAFTHQLYRQAVYEQTPAGRRQRLHRRIGNSLEAIYGERSTEVAPELAIHFEQGHDPAKTLRYLAAAAARAAQRLAGREAISYLAAAIAFTANVPEAIRRQQELELRCTLAPVLGDFRGFASEELRQNCERAHELCLEVGTDEQLFQISYALAHVYAARADRTRMPALLEEIEHIARRGKPAYRLLSDTLLVRVLVHQAKLVEVRRLMEEGPLAADATSLLSEPFPVCGIHPVIGAKCAYAYALWHLGDPELAKSTARAALAAASHPSIGPFTRAGALAWAGLVYVLCGEASEARKLGEELLAASTEHSFPLWSAYALGIRGWARVQEGEWREGIEELQRTRAMHDAAGVRVLLGLFVGLLAESHLRSGEIAAGLAAVEYGLELAESTLDCAYRPELWRLKAELLLHQAGVEDSSRSPAKARAKARNPADEQVEELLRASLAGARGTHAKSLERRTAASLVRFLKRTGRGREAAALLAEAGTPLPTQPASPRLKNFR